MQAAIPLRHLADIEAENERLTRQWRAIEERLEQNHAETRARMDETDRSRGFCFRNAPCNLRGTCRRLCCRRREGR